MPQVLKTFPSLYASPSHEGGQAWDQTPVQSPRAFPYRNPMMPTENPN